MDPIPTVVPSRLLQRYEDPSHQRQNLMPRKKSVGGESDPMRMDRTAGAFASGRPQQSGYYYRWLCLLLAAGGCRPRHCEALLSTSTTSPGQHGRATRNPPRPPCGDGGGLWIHDHVTPRRGCHPSRLRALSPTTIAASETSRLSVEQDYLITDSIHVLPQDRPALSTVLTRPTNLLRGLLLGTGVGISACNVVGNYYSGDYVMWQGAALSVALLTALADYQASLPPYKDDAPPLYHVSPRVRCGVVDDAVVHVYAAVYTTAAAWLALRAGPLCPPWLAAGDAVLGLAAAAVFVFSFLAPLWTLVYHYNHAWRALQGPLSALVRGARRQGPDVAPPPGDPPALTATEILRAQSLLGVGVVGCLFAPIAVKFAIAGPAWWGHVLEVYPEQGLLESSTALFGIFATQASMVAHASAKAGVAPLRGVVPAFAGVCAVLTIIPCACALFWLDDSTFFAHYAM